jgi:transposase
VGKSSEIISTVQRRRNWSTEEKVAILEAAFSKGGSVSAAADRFGVSRPLIYIWRKQVRNGELPGVAMTESGIAAFARIAISEPQAGAAAPLPVSGPDDPAPCARGASGRRRSGLIEVRFANGRSLKADETIAPDILKRLAAVLDGEAA